MDENTFSSFIWNEEPMPDDPFHAERCFCHGYDVYGDLVGQLSFTDYVYLLFKGEVPDKENSALFNDLFVAFANLGPRDYSINAAMNCGVTKGTAASGLIAAIGVGAGGYLGSRDLSLCMDRLKKNKQSLDQWNNYLCNYTSTEHVEDVLWPKTEHIPGFNPHCIKTPKPIIELLDHFASIKPNSMISFFQKHHQQFAQWAGCSLSMISVASTVFYELSFRPLEAEYIYLFMRLPGAAAHAFEQSKLGLKHFPMFFNGLKLENS